MEDIEDILLLIEQELSKGKKPIMGSGTIVNATIIYELVERIRNGLPDMVREAKHNVLNSAKMQRDETEKAQQIIAKAQTKAEQMLSEHEIIKIAEKEAEAIKREALEFKSRLTQEIGKDISTMLSALEKTLQENLKIVKNAQENCNEKFSE